MTKRETNLWQGIDPGAQSALTPRDYRTASFAPLALSLRNTVFPIHWLIRY